MNKSSRYNHYLQVIGTDMSKHMDHVANLRTRVEMQKLSSYPEGELDLQNHADRVQVRPTRRRVPLTYVVARVTGQLADWDC